MVVVLTEIIRIHNVHIYIHKYNTHTKELTCNGLMNYSVFGLFLLCLTSYITCASYFFFSRSSVSDVKISETTMLLFGFGYAVHEIIHEENVSQFMAKSRSSINYS